MARILTSPADLSELEIFPRPPAIFLAGSIEMGKARNWQKEVITALQEQKQDIIIVNPRRDDWLPPTDPAEARNALRAQATWEMDALDSVDFVIMYFDPATTSPISLLELGLLTKTPGRIAVCCPAGFYRKDNVDLVCERYGIPMVESLEELKSLSIIQSRDKK